MDGIGTLIVLAIAIFIYFLPTVIGRRKRNVTAIFVLNLFLGWSIIGWIVALVWACTTDPQPTIIQNNVSTPPVSTNQPGTSDQLQLLDHMRATGKLSNDEYWEERKRLNLL